MGLRLVWVAGEGEEGGGADQFVVGIVATVPSSKVKTTAPASSFVTVKLRALRATSPVISYCRSDLRCGRTEFPRLKELLPVESVEN